MLSQAGVEFISKNVDEDEQAYDELLALTFRTVPVTIIGGRVIKGFDPEALKSALAALADGPSLP